MSDTRDRKLLTPRPSGPLARRHRDQRGQAWPRNRRPLAAETLEGRRLLAVGSAPGLLQLANAAPADVSSLLAEDLVGVVPITSPASPTAPGSSLAASTTVGEAEPAGTIGQNDTPASGQFLAGFGTGPGEDPEFDVTGRLFDDSSTPTQLGPFAEDDGAIPLAGDTGLTSAGSPGVVVVSGTVGDGPHGSAGTGAGDWDYFSLEAAPGDVLRVNFQEGTLADSVTALYDSSGTLLVLNDNEFFGTLDSAFTFTMPDTAPNSATYYVAIGGYVNNGSGSASSPSDPFDPASGPGLGNTAFSQGSYELLVGLNSTDVDHFRIDLAAGDILGANLTGGIAAELALLDPQGVLAVGSATEVSIFNVIPSTSPLPLGGDANLSFVAPVSGTYAVAVGGGGLGPYTLQLRAFRPALEQQPLGAHQYLFVDFDGATVDKSIYGGTGSAALSPLSAFLAGWGLGPADENAVIDAVLAEVERVYRDVAVVGNNGDLLGGSPAGSFQLEILNSRDHADPFGLFPHVSRVVVGGSIDEFGVPTLGVSETIDPGNFATDETAVVLLDIVSGTSTAVAPGGPDDINAIPRQPSASIVDVVGAVVGQLVAHEAGHFFGNYHTESVLTAVVNTADRGGNGVADDAGVGGDGIFGTADDVSRTFGVDSYSSVELFSGSQDTRNRVAFGLSTGTGAGAFYDIVNRELFVSGSVNDGQADHLQLRRVASGTAVEVFVNGQSQGTTPLDAIDRVTLNGSSDRDTFDVVALGGVAISVHGDAPTSSPGDALIVNATGAVDNPLGISAGFVTIPFSALIRYDGVEEVTIAGDTADPPGDPPSASQILVSSTSGGNAAGLRFKDEDILSFDTSEASWELLLDGSDVGVAVSDVNAFHVLDNGDLLLSFVAPLTVPSLGTVDDSDIVRFVPSSLGNASAGTFEWYFDGSDVSLATNGEDIDAIGIAPNGNLVISVVGALKDGGSLVGRDEDLFEFQATSLGTTTAGSWSLYFDGSDVGLTAKGEDIVGVWIDPQSGDLLLTTHKDLFSVPGLSGDADDVIRFVPTSLGASTSGSFSLYWDGDDHGFGNELVDGLSLPAGTTLTASGLAASGLAPLSSDLVGNVAVAAEGETPAAEANEKLPSALADGTAALSQHTVDELFAAFGQSEPETAELAEERFSDLLLEEQDDDLESDLLTELFELDELLS